MLHHLLTDIVSGANLGVLAVGGTEEVCLFPLVVVGDAVIQLLSAIGAVQQTRKGTDDSEKLTEIIRNNNIKSVTIVRMEVPCCGGLEHAAKIALQNSGKFIPWQVVTISTDGNILD